MRHKTSKKIANKVQEVCKNNKMTLKESTDKVQWSGKSKNKHTYKNKLSIYYVTEPDGAECESLVLAVIMVLFSI